MGFTLKLVAHREWGVLGGRQSISRGKLGANITPCVADHLGMVFERSRKRRSSNWLSLGLSDMFNRARLEARYPPGNRAASNFEQINAFDSRCDHRHPSSR